jgi:hypothetical protein
MPDRDTSGESRFAPELGQAMFGQPAQQLAVEGTVLASVLEALTNSWDVARPNEPNPFSNSGHRFDGAHIQVHAYSWGDEEQPWNLLWRDLRISWYKHCGRSASVNRAVTDDEARELLVDGLTDVLSNASASPSSQGPDDATSSSDGRPLRV